MGGGSVTGKIRARFVELAGGSGRASIVVLPMASADPDAGLEAAEAFRSLGARAERLILDRARAEGTEAVARIQSATGVWFGGGDQSKLTAAIRGTRTETAIHDFYRRGGVVGGTSAGAAVMSTPMLTGDERHPGGDRPPAQESNDAYMTIARENVVTTPGLGLLPGAIVDQHFVRRRRHNRLISLVLENPELIGVGIDESTALEVDPGSPWRVLGESVVVIYDARQSSRTAAGHTLGAADLRMHVLPEGSSFDPTTGIARLPQPSSLPAR